MPAEISEGDDVNDDDVKTFKYPYLKNTHSDSHFDLTDPHDLAGKTLLWVARDSQSLPENLRQSLRLLGAALYKKLDLASSLASSSVHGGVATIVRRMFTPKEGEEPTELQKQILEKLSGCSASEEPVSSAVRAILEKILEKEEETVAKRQAEEFTSWHQRRQDLIKAQADRLLLKIRAEEISKELAELEHETEKLTFFENRLKWEKKAAQNAEIIKQTADNKSEEGAQ
ncbi:hypothetical protein OESDEN_03293 [Oesophagostomum dentatum]|uniref:Uncharacterized protein n=1 Tax=Oesophagostomum dentatum TaxID=61180 RepID=A0A0B1TMX5_OESDE|nr:hypothetical protein OESDEN_03293 [Oesophagostomum dentatum]